MPGQWEEAKHPRANDGKFGEGAGSAGGSRRSAVAAKAVKAKPGTDRKSRVVAAAVKSRRGTATAEAPAAYDAAKHPPPYADFNRLPEKERGKAIVEIERLAPRPDGALVHAFGNAAIKDEGGFRAIALKPEGQKAVREHFDGLMSKYGIIPAPGQEVGRHQIETKPDADMGGAAGFKLSTGKIQVGQNWMSKLYFHAGDGPLSAERLADLKAGGLDNGLFAYNVMAHETLHAHGPQLMLSRRSDGTINDAHHVLADEMSTEMAANHVTMTEHGLSPYDNNKGIAYGDYLQPAIRMVAEAAGVPHEQAFGAVTHAALVLKRRTGQMDATDALRDMAEDSLRKLQKFTPEAHADLYKRWDELSGKILSKVREVQANAKSIK